MQDHGFQAIKLAIEPLGITGPEPHKRLSGLMANLTETFGRNCLGRSSGLSSVTVGHRRMLAHVHIRELA